MSSIPRLLLISTIIQLFPDEIANKRSAIVAAEDASAVAPMLMVKSTLKSWHSMYNSYREEVNLGYCWADYFFDINNLINVLTGARFAGLDQAESSSALFALLRRWFDPEKSEPVGIYRSSDENGENLDDGFGEEKQDEETAEIFHSLDPRIDDDASLSSLTETPLRTTGRGLSDLFISVLGLNTPPGVGPMMLGVGSSPAAVVASRILGTFFRVGRQILEAIEKTQILSCTKDYLMIKAFRWIDS